MIQFALPSTVAFFSTPGQDTATLPRTSEMGRLARRDVLRFGAHDLLVLDLNREHIVLARKQEYKMRRLGGVAYRRWLVSENECDPRPQRAVPLRRVKPIWRNIRIPAGTMGFLIYQAHCEGAAG